MNPTQLNDEPLKLHEVAAVTAIVVATCAGVAICFTAAAVCQYAGDTLNRIRRKGGRHAPKLR